MAFERLHHNKEKYNDEYIKLQQYCFRGISDEQLKREWENLTSEEGSVLGIVEEDKIAAALTIFNHPISFYGGEVSMGGVGLVATSPYHREGGCCRKLIRHALGYMDEKGMLFSALGPFNYSFYEQFGYKWSYRFYTYKVALEDIRTFKMGGKIVEVNNHKDIVEKLYLEMASGCNGMTLRTKKMWEDKWQEERTTKVVCCSAQGEVEAYMFFNIDNGIFWIEEIYYKTLTALKDILNFVYKHRAQVDGLHIKTIYPIPIMDLLKNPYGEVKEEPFMMARIVNVQKVLECYPFTTEGCLVMKVIDTEYAKNDGTYCIHIKQGKTEVIKEDSKIVDIEVDIAHLTQLLLGFRKIEELIFTENIVMHQDVKKYFENTLSTGLYNYF